jgi:hypothetical protein
MERRSTLVSRVVGTFVARSSLRVTIFLSKALLSIRDYGSEGGNAKNAKFKQAQPEETNKEVSINSNGQQ